MPRLHAPGRVRQNRSPKRTRTACPLCPVISALPCHLPRLGSGHPSLRQPITAGPKDTTIMAGRQMLSIVRRKFFSRFQQFERQIPLWRGAQLNKSASCREVTLASEADPFPRARCATIAAVSSNSRHIRWRQSWRQHVRPSPPPGGASQPRPWPRGICAGKNVGCCRAAGAGIAAAPHPGRGRGTVGRFDVVDGPDPTGGRHHDHAPLSEDLPGIGQADRRSHGHGQRERGAQTGPGDHQPDKAPPKDPRRQQATAVPSGLCALCG